MLDSGCCGLARDFGVSASSSTSVGAGQPHRALPLDPQERNAREWAPWDSNPQPTDQQIAAPRLPQPLPATTVPEPATPTSGCAALGGDALALRKVLRRRRDRTISTTTPMMAIQRTAI